MGCDTRGAGAWSTAHSVGRGEGGALSCAPSAHAVAGKRGAPMTTVKQILDTKGYAVWSIHPQESVFTAIQQMAEKGVGALVVLEGDAVVGIISERDYARKVILQNRSSHETAVQ